MTEPEQKLGDGIIEEECRPEEIQELVMSGEYHQAILLLGHTFESGDGGWTEWVFLQLHHHHLQWTQQQEDQRSCTEFIHRVSQRMADFSLDQLDRSWQCFGHICSYYQQPFDPFVFYNSWIHYSMTDLVCDMAKRGDVGSIQIVWHYFPIEADPHFWRPHLNPTMPASEYVHLMDLGDLGALKNHIMERYRSTGLLQDWAELLDGYEDWPQLKLMSTELLSHASDDDRSIQLELKASNSAMISREGTTGSVAPERNQPLQQPEVTENGHAGPPSAADLCAAQLKAQPTVSLDGQKPCSRPRSLSIESDGERTPLISNESSSRVEEENLTAKSSSSRDQSDRHADRKLTCLNGTHKLPHESRKPEGQESNKGYPQNADGYSQENQTNEHGTVQRTGQDLSGVDNNAYLDQCLDATQAYADGTVAAPAKDPTGSLTEAREERSVTEDKTNQATNETNGELPSVSRQRTVAGSGESASNTVSESMRDMISLNGQGHVPETVESEASEHGVIPPGTLVPYPEGRNKVTADSTTPTQPKLEEDATRQCSPEGQIPRTRLDLSTETTNLRQMEELFEASTCDCSTDGSTPSSIPGAHTKLSKEPPSPTRSRRKKRKPKLRFPTSNGSTLEEDLNDFSKALQAVVIANRRDKKKRREVTGYLLELTQLFGMLQERYRAEHWAPVHEGSDDSSQRLPKETPERTNGVKREPLGPDQSHQPGKGVARVLTQKEAAIKELENKIAKMEEHFDLQHTADVARIEYLEDLLYEIQTEEGTNPVATSQKHRSSSPPAMATTPPNGIKSATVAVSPQEIQRLAYALEVSEQHRAQALEDLQRERELHAQKLRSLQAAFSRLMPTPPPYEEHEEESSEEADESETYGYFGDLQHYYALPPTSTFDE